MHCHDQKVISSNPSWIELGEHSILLSRPYLNQKYQVYAVHYSYMWTRQVSMHGAGVPLTVHHGIPVCMPRCITAAGALLVCG